jgi:hypothetical protein
MGSVRHGYLNRGDQAAALDVEGTDWSPIRFCRASGGRLDARLKITEIARYARKNQW